MFVRSLREITRRLLGLLSRLERLGALVIFVAEVACAAMVTAATTPTNDPDIWWVAAAGREMLSQAAVQRVNLFSYVEPDHPWIMHEWLLGPIYAAGLSRFGPPFFAAVAIVGCALGLYLVLSMTVGRSSHRWVGLVTAFVCLACFSSRLLTPRPTGIALLMPLLLARVAFGPRFSRATAVAAVAIVLVWTNLHGSFPLGILLLLVAASLDADRSRRVTAAAIAACATLVNPYGLELHRFVVGYLLGHEGIYREINANITEFQNVEAAFGGTIGPIELVGWVLVTGVAVLALRSARYRVRAAFCLLLLAGSLRQVRHMELAGLLGCFLLMPYAEELAASSAAPERSETWRRRFVHGLVAFATVLGLGLFGFELRHRGERDWIAAGPDFLAGLDKVPNDSHLLVSFSKAGMAIWYGRPRGIQVFFDSRNDCYSASTFSTFLALSGPKPSDAEIGSVLASTRTNAVLVSPRHRLVEWAARQSTVRATYASGAFRGYYWGDGV